MAGTMKALYFDGNLELREMPIPEPRTGEALIELSYAGICNTDIEITRGYMGFTGVPGHEFVGRVVECADAEWIGKRVVGEINLPCGRCLTCLGGLGRHCPSRQVLGIVGKQGALAQFLTLPVVNLHEVPETVSDRAATFVEPLAAAYRILEQRAVLDTDEVLVLGDGKLAQLIARVLRGKVRNLVVVGKHQSKLDLLENRRVNTVILGEYDPHCLGPSDKYNAVVEATGSPAGLDLALDSLGPCGRLILKSTFHSNVQLQSSRIVVDEIKIIGSRCGPFEPALEALADGQVQVEDLISNVFPLADGIRAFKRAQEPGVLKVLLDCR